MLPSSRTSSQGGNTSTPAVTTNKQRRNPHFTKTANEIMRYCKISDRGRSFVQVIQCFECSILQQLRSLHLHNRIKWNRSLYQWFICTLKISLKSLSLQVTSSPLLQCLQKEISLLSQEFVAYFSKQFAQIQHWLYHAKPTKRGWGKSAVGVLKKEQILCVACL